MKKIEDEEGDRMKIDSVAFSFAGDKYLGRPYSEMDCQAFVEQSRRLIFLHKAS